MRLLHTADWHLGVSSAHISRGPDHDLFLDWLLEQLESREIDALLVAGDIFDAYQPSAEVTERLFGFLAKVFATGVPQVVLVGGNHDSASRLQAPASVLRALDVHVVGGLTRESVERGDHVIGLRGRSGEMEAVVLAVPYVHEFRLGIRTTDSDHTEVHRRFTEAFRGVYAELTDQAAARYPGLPIVATGHLTVGHDVQSEDYGQEIHQVGSIDALPASLFDQRIQYVALGHIHRSYPTDDQKRVWYSGSPIPISLPEAQTRRRVLQVDLGPQAEVAPHADGSPQSHAPRAEAPNAEAPAAVTPIDIPLGRQLLKLEGDADDLPAAIRALKWSEPLPPLLYLHARADELPSDFASRVLDATASHPEGARPAIAETRQIRVTPLARMEPEEVPQLEDLEPGEVFATLVRGTGAQLDDPLKAAFGHLLGMTDDDLQAEVTRLEEERP
jgi:exonuclease SbcD